MLVLKLRVPSLQPAGESKIRLQFKRSGLAPDELNIISYNTGYDIDECLKRYRVERPADTKFEKDLQCWLQRTVQTELQKNLDLMIESLEDGDSFLLMDWFGKTRHEKVLNAMRVSDPDISPEGLLDEFVEWKLKREFAFSGVVLH